MPVATVGKTRGFVFDQRFHAKHAEELVSCQSARNVLTKCFEIVLIQREVKVVINHCVAGVTVSVSATRQDGPWRRRPKVLTIDVDQTVAFGSGRSQGIRLVIVDVNFNRERFAEDWSNDGVKVLLQVISQHFSTSNSAWIGRIKRSGIEPSRACLEV